MKKKSFLIIIGVIIFGIILVTLTGCGNSQKEILNQDNKNENVQKQEISKEEKTYNTATIAEEKGYYTVAKNLYNQILDYKDSKEHYEKMMTILKEYNGTYYGESTQYKNVYYYIYIQDGEVRVQMSNSTSNQSKYELYVYGKDNEKGNDILAFSDRLTNLFSNKTDAVYGDGYAINKLDSEKYLVAATEGSMYHTFNGFYEKTSENVEDSSMFE